jgi:hypothetical protein
VHSPAQHFRNAEQPLAASTNGNAGLRPKIKKAENNTAAEIIFELR